MFSPAKLWLFDSRLQRIRIRIVVALKWYAFTELFIRRDVVKTELLTDT